MVGVALLVLFVSFIYATSSGDSQWFSRGGSVATILGLLLTIKHSVLSVSRDIHSVVKEKFHYAVWAPERDSKEYEDNIAVARRIIRDEYMGIVLTVVGTIFWGYGDLIHSSIIMIWL